MTVSELIQKLQECAPSAEVEISDGYIFVPVDAVKSNGEKVRLT